MNLFGVMETSGSAMQAERMRAEVTAANMANVETTRTPDGGPYRRQHVVFAANGGDPGFLDSMNDATTVGVTGSSNGGSFTNSLVGGQLMNAGFTPTGMRGLGSSPVAPGVHITQVVQDTSPPLERYDPGHPDADANGYVAYPDINPVTEMVDLMGATRAYGLNGSAVQAEKSMITTALDLAKG